MQTWADFKYLLSYPEHKEIVLSHGPSATRSRVMLQRGHAPQRLLGLKEKAEESLLSLCDYMALEDLSIFLAGLPFVLVHL